MITASPSLFSYVDTNNSGAISVLIWIFFGFSAMSLNPAVTGSTPSFNLINPAFVKKLKKRPTSAGFVDAYTTALSGNSFNDLYFLE